MSSRTFSQPIYALKKICKLLYQHGISARLSEAVSFPLEKERKQVWLGKQKGGSFWRAKEQTDALPTAGESLSFYGFGGPVRDRALIFRPQLRILDATGDAESPFAAPNLLQHLPWLSSLGFFLPESRSRIAACRSRRSTFVSRADYTLADNPRLFASC